MAISEKERDSIQALVEESKETEEIARQLEAFVRRPASTDKLRAVRLNMEALATPLLPPPKKT